MLHEVDTYFNSSFDSDELGPLQFWKTQSSSNKLPKLSLIARGIYCIPATQNRSERVFSGAGHIVTDLRTSLDPENVDELILLRFYHKMKLEDKCAQDSEDSEEAEDE